MIAASPSHIGRCHDRDELRLVVTDDVALHVLEVCHGFVQYAEVPTVVSGVREAANIDGHIAVRATQLDRLAENPVEIRADARVAELLTVDGSRVHTRTLRPFGRRATRNGSRSERPSFSRQRAYSGAGRSLTLLPSKSEADRG